MMHEYIIGNHPLVAADCRPSTIVVVLEETEAVFLTKQSDFIEQATAHCDTEEGQGFDLTSLPQTTANKAASLLRHFRHGSIRQRDLLLISDIVGQRSY